jgi:endonuclease G
MIETPLTGLHDDGAPLRVVTPPDLPRRDTSASAVREQGEMAPRLAKSGPDSRGSSRFVIPPLSDAALYAERIGFRDDFLGDGARMRVSLPPMTDEEELLRYANFSIVFSLRRKLARLSAINVDGARLQRIQRRKPDTWSYDPRVAHDQQVGRNLYDGVRYDHAQLVRRQDACSGRDAELAEQDTFHLTNAVPQDLQLGCGPWNTLEHHVLDTIRLSHSRVTVLAGPIFDDAGRCECGIQIPANYFKIASYIDDDGHLSAAGWVQRLPSSQNAVLELSSASTASFTIWQVSISWISELTNLDLSPLFAADALGRHRLRPAAAELQPIPIAEADDLLL